MTTEHKPQSVPPRCNLDWRLTRRDIYGEEAYVVESATIPPDDDDRRTWSLRGHWTRDELDGLGVEIMKTLLRG